MDIHFSKPNLSSLPGSTKNLSYAWLEIIGMAVIVGLFVWFVVLPKRAEVAAKAEAVKKLQDQADTTASQLKTLQELIASLKSHQKEVRDLDIAMPVDDTALRFQLYLKSLVDSVGLTVADVSVNSTNSGAVVAGNKTLLTNPYGQDRALQFFSGNVSVVGNFNQISTLLSKLEQSGRIINLKTLDLTATDAGIGLRVSFESYFLGINATN